MPDSSSQPSDSAVRFWNPAPGANHIAPSSELVAMPAVDVRAETRRAIWDPIEFPRLGKAVVPGDRITIAMGAELHAAADVVAELVGEFLEHGIDPGDISLLVPASLQDEISPGDDPRTALDGRVRALVHLVTHDPHARGELAYLAADAAGNPVYLNRALVDADQVVFVDRTCPATANRGDRLGHGLFPLFADAAAQSRLRNSWRERRTRSGDEDAAHEAQRLLGMLFLVAEVVGRGQAVLSIHAGEADAVARAAERAYRAAWTRRWPQPARLVVASFEGHATWPRAGRALRAARELTSSGGAIALCTPLDSEPPERLARLGDIDPRAGEPLERGGAETGEAWVVEEFAASLAQGPLYLQTLLDTETIEAMGCGSIGSTAELERLISRAESCIVLTDADCVLPEIAGAVPQVARAKHIRRRP